MVKNSLYIRLFIIFVSSFLLNCDKLNEVRPAIDECNNLYVWASGIKFIYSFDSFGTLTIRPSNGEAPFTYMANYEDGTPILIESNADTATLEVVKYQDVIFSVIDANGCESSQKTFHIEQLDGEKLKNFRLLSGTWTVNQVVAPSSHNDIDINWDNLKINFGGSTYAGIYTTSGHDWNSKDLSTVLWPENGSWKFSDVFGDRLVRDNYLEVDFGDNSYSDQDIFEGLVTEIQLTIYLPEGLDNTQEIYGEWVFKLEQIRSY